MSNQKEKKLRREIQQDNRIPVKREKPSERASFRVVDWLRERRINRGIREVPFMPYEEKSSKSSHEQS